MFAGSRYILPENRGWELLNTDPDIEGIPDRQAARFVERRTYREFAIFWPAGQHERHPDADHWQQPALSGQPDSVRGAWRPASLHTGSARVVLGVEDAAAIANGIERSHYLDLIREAMYDELSNLAIGEAALLADLQLGGAPVSPEAVRYVSRNAGAVASHLESIQMAATPVPAGIPE